MISASTHLGVLLPEFGLRVLEVLRQPMEDKIVTISRAQGSLTFPANFQLVAAKIHARVGINHNELLIARVWSPVRVRIENNFHSIISTGFLAGS